MTAPTGTRRISHDLSDLYAEERKKGKGFLHYEVVIVGSGYGGAMAAAELAGRKDSGGRDVSILVLERGKEYVPGMFPSSGQELPSHVRVHGAKSGKTIGRRDGLFDIRVGPDVCALLANGLGGGSLINAGVMEMPDWNSVPRMPESLKNDLDRATLQHLKGRLGAAVGAVDNTIALHPCAPGGTSKTIALKSLDPPGFRHAAITVEMTGNGALPRCELCGDCMTGCNVGAKKSLDTSLLLEAWGMGAKIRTGASVIGVTRATDPARWELSVVFTVESLRRRHQPLRIRAREVILAAGTLGSPEILMRSENFGLRFSPRLGQQFSCNGDNILALQGSDLRTNSVAQEFQPLDRRNVGPTITGIIDVKKEQSGPAFLIQEFGVPAALKRIFEELVTTSSLLHELGKQERQSHVKDDKGLDPLAVDAEKMDKVLVLGIIGHDESSGELELPVSPRLDENQECEGRLRIHWPGVRKSALINDAYERAGKLFPEQWKKAPVLPNPLWRLLPEDLDFVFRSERGPLLTVHPLGGCPIGPSRDEGVVDQYGRVYDFSPRKGTTDLHEGLWVLDGSVLPSSLGVNPALTIAAVAQRSAIRMAQECVWTRPGVPVPAPAKERPRSRELLQCTPAAPVATEIELTEKLCGPFHFRRKPYMAELTVRYAPLALASLSANMGRQLTVTTGKSSTLRLYQRADWDEKGVQFLDEPARSAHALVVVPLESGRLSLLQREASPWWWRTIRGVVAYVVNRGLRDLWSSGREFFSRPGKWKRLFALACRAGEVRTFEYTLGLGAPEKGKDTALGKLIGANRQITGVKRLTYSVHGNPWRQLTELQLTSFLGFPRRAQPMLQLDGRFMARQAIPLARIVVQENQVHALAETATFGLYFLRLLVSIHLWSFRAPDPMPGRKRDLLPGSIKGLPEPELIEIELEAPRHGIPVLVRLTRYKGKKHDTAAQSKPPLVMIHGYSASGSTFTHEAVPEPMARYFWDKGRDVWVLDLRTSAGMPSAPLPWNFEDAALADIPVAIQRILSVTGHKQVDVFAHCIGAVMLSMALLTDGTENQWPEIEAVDPPDGVRPRRYKDEVAALSGSIRRIVLSQKGPALVYSDGNVLRAYLIRLLRGLILPQNYQFRAPANPSLAEQALDRLLSSLPYPDDELARENPWWPCAKTPWVGFRHRMDALYSRDFSLKNIEGKTLAALEDLFGPLNLDTVSQAVHFARYNKITNGAGRNCFVTVTRMKARWPKDGTLSIHGEENGLADVRTLVEMRRLMEEAELGQAFKTLPVPGMGHQDCLIGSAAREAVFDRIEEFLS